MIILTIYLVDAILSRHSNGQISLYKSMESELLRALESIYNFTSVLVDGEDSWGMERNGRWVGMVGQVLYGVSPS